VINLLTKDNIIITQDGDVFIPIIGHKDIKSRTPQAKQLKQQILNDQKLRERIEKRQKDARGSGELSDYDCGMVYDEIQELLEGSKK